MYEYDFVHVGYGSLEAALRALAETPVSTDRAAVLSQYCNARGRDGWRLHSTTFSETQYVSLLIFEREVQQ